MLKGGQRLFRNASVWSASSIKSNMARSCQAVSSRILGPRANVSTMQSYTRFRYDAVVIKLTPFSASTHRNYSSGTTSFTASSTLLNTSTSSTSSYTSTNSFGSGSTSRPLELRYLEASGTLTILIPLTESNSSEPCMFSLRPESTVQTFIDKIMHEDSSIKNVQLRSSKGSPFPADTLIQQLMIDDFQILINEKILRVSAPVFTGDAYTSLPQDGQLDIRAVAHKTAIIKLRDLIQYNSKWKIDCNEFFQLAQDHGIPMKQARQVLHALHQVGIVFHFSQSSDEELRNSIFLKPRNILDSYFNGLGLPTPTIQQFTEKSLEIKAVLESIESEYQSMFHLKQELDLMANSRTNFFCYLSSAGLFGTFGLYSWLAFIHFSWDIMEPVTYFTGFGVTVGGYIWWTFTNQEYEYENIYDYIFQKKRQVLYKRANFDVSKMEGLHKKVTSLQSQLTQLEQATQKPTCLQSEYLTSLLKKCN